MGDRKTYLTNQIVKYSQRLDRKFFGANHDGNISAKFENTLLATPTAVSKGNVVSEIIITLDMDGKKIAGVGKPFSEISLHFSAYKARDDINAVVHAHPPFATARGLVGMQLEPSIPEAIVSIGDVVPIIEFAMPGAPENAALIAKTLENYDVFMMPGNGVFSVGVDVEQAYLRLELVEHLAKIQFYAEQMGAPMKLTEENKNKLLEKRAAIGLGPKSRKISPPPVSNNSMDAIKDLIAQEIKKIIEN